jgi:hypothetical protein
LNKLFPCSRYSTFTDYIHRFLNFWCTIFFPFFLFCFLFNNVSPPFSPQVHEWNEYLSYIQ